MSQTVDSGRAVLPHGLGVEDLPGARKAVPIRALLLSLSAMAVAAYGAFSHPEFLAGYDSLSWLLLLVPAFLLAYYRGWKGAVRAFAAGTLCLLLVEFLAEYLLGVNVEWDFLVLVSLVVVLVGLGLGVLSELLQKERVEALVLAYSDPLTGLPNRRLLDFMLGKEFAAAQRGRPLSVVLFDVDGFKSYNDAHGHGLGDEALREIADVLEDNTRYMNVTGRYGGEEFLSILSGEKAEGAWVFTERTRVAVAEMAMAGTGESVTLSAGIASYHPSLTDPAELVAWADEALRRAKREGRNRTCIERAPDQVGELPDDVGRLAPAARRELERDQQRRLLEESEVRYRNLFNRVPVGLYRSRPTGEILDANPALMQMLGFPTRKSLLSACMGDLWVDPEARRRWLVAMGRDGLVRNFEAELRRADASTIWVRDSARAVLVEGGDVSHYEGVVEDITEQKRAEFALREANEALRAAIQASPLAMITLDGEGRVTTWNAAAERMFGWSREEALHRQPPFLGVENEKDFRVLLSRVLEGEPLVEQDLARRRRDGSRIELSLWAAPLRDGKGRVTGVMAVLADWTERRELELQLRQAQRLESIGLLAGGIAHDFNNLITAILANCDLLAADLDPEDARQMQVSEIQGVARRAAALTRQLLTFARRSRVEPQAIDLNELVREVEPMLGRLLGAEIELVMRLSADPAVATADRSQIEQVIMNLAVNARDAMPEGGTVTIETGCARHDGRSARGQMAKRSGRYAMLAVADEGAGMDEATRSRIFEPFFTTKEQGKGTGLGLATVYGIVKESGGFVWVESEIGEGARFEIHLPATPEGERVAASAGPNGSGSRSLARGR